MQHHTIPESKKYFCDQNHTLPLFFRGPSRQNHSARPVPKEKIKTQKNKEKSKKRDKTAPASRKTSKCDDRHRNILTNKIYSKQHKTSRKTKTNIKKHLAASILPTRGKGKERGRRKQSKNSSKAKKSKRCDGHHRSILQNKIY